jgi:hypothetical protein
MSSTVENSNYLQILKCTGGWNFSSLGNEIDEYQQRCYKNK